MRTHIKLVLSVVAVSAASLPGYAGDPEVVATIRLSGPLCCTISGVTVNPDTNRIYVADLARAAVYVVDGSTNEHIDTISVGRRTWRLAVDPFSNRVFAPSIAENSIYILDGKSHEISAIVRLEHLPYAAAFNSADSRLYLTNPTVGRVGVIHDRTVTDLIAIGHGLRGIAVDAVSNRVYVANDKGYLGVIKGGVNEREKPVSTRCRPADVAVDAVASRLYVSDRANGALCVIDPSTGADIRQVALGGRPRGIASSPLRNRIYVAMGDRNVVQIIDGPTARVIHTVPTGDGPYEVAVNPLTERVYVANYRDGTLTVISDRIPGPLPAQLLAAYLNHILVDVAATAPALVPHVQSALAVLSDSRTENDFKAAISLESLVEEIQANERLPEDRVRKVVLAARRIIVMFTGA